MLEVNCMDNITINKIIVLNCDKRFGKNGKNLAEKYRDFVNSLNKEYLLNVVKELSISDTPIVSIFDTKQRKLPSIYFWCFDNVYYVKTPTETFIVGTCEEALKVVDNYFYK